MRYLYIILLSLALLFLAASGMAVADGRAAVKHRHAVQSSCPPSARKACNGDVDLPAHQFAPIFPCRVRASLALAAAADMNVSGLVTAVDFNLLRARINTAPGPSGLHP